MNALIAPSIIFLLFVAPIWIITHYRYKSKMVNGISEAETENIDQMLALIDTLTDRVETLEELLNSDHPDWKNNVKRQRPE
jgi:phage shock protein B